MQRQYFGLLVTTVNFLDINLINANFIQIMLISLKAELVLQFTKFKNKF